MSNNKQVSKEEWTRTWRAGLHPWMKQHDPDHYKELYAVAYGKVRPSKPVSPEEWDRTFVAGLHPEMKQSDPVYWNALYASKFGQAPSFPAMGTAQGPEATSPATDDFYKLSLEEVLQAIKADAKGFLTKYRERFKPLDYTRLLKAAQSIKADSDYPRLVSDIMNAARATDPRNPHREHGTAPLAADPRIIPARTPQSKPFNPEGLSRDKQQATTAEHQAEFCRLKDAGELERVKKESPAYYLKLLKAWDTSPNPYKV